MCVQSLSRVLLFATPQIVVHQSPLPIGLPRQEYWSGLPFPTPGNLPDLGIIRTSPSYPAVAGKFFLTEPPGKPWLYNTFCNKFIILFTQKAH